MKKPADGRRAEADNASLAKPQDCPWPCLYAGHHHDITDESQTVRGTWCELCDTAVTRGEWYAELQAVGA